ncbi:PREDICTED: cAMP-regulated phospho [Prunus dulcis]|uniref:PREDICTED: cAMP-regulated phospho n=1 Tax=Prunus dulcis TaxID=3755 RepID=A0A5E4F926_PRUDU|nr:PREDICTED: cAMP-regulated phospho [Prunus dulcis]
MSPVRIPLLVDKLYCSHFALPQGEPKMADCNRGEDYFSAQDHEASTVVQKYGGLAPKKKPLISKDHERAFFDSADWALCKVLIIPTKMKITLLLPYFFNKKIHGCGTARCRGESKINSSRGDLTAKTAENAAPAAPSKETCLEHTDSFVVFRGIEGSK